MAKSKFNQIEERYRKAAEYNPVEPDGISCKICGKEFETDVSLHRHLKVHKTLMVDYYHAYYPRKDLYTGDLIKFKNKHQYFSEDFNDRRSMKKWFNKASNLQAKDYCDNYLKKRIEEKNIIYTLCEVESRSLMCPPVPYLHTVFEGYYSYCARKFNLKNKYEIYPEDMETPIDITPGNIKARLNKIYVDTREQKPLKFDMDIKIQALKYGDYCLSNSKMSFNTYIERKSITDFIGTMSGGYDRFKREVERASEDGAKLVVLVEDSLPNCLNFKFLPYVSKKIKASPEFIFHNVRQLIQDYENLHFLFVKGRPEASRVIQKLFLHASKYHKVDLQLAYDLRKL